jgi:hypothetical protein
LPSWAPVWLRSVGDESYAQWVLIEAVIILLVGVVLQKRLLVLPAVAFISIIAFQFLLLLDRNA